jgi:hypothetical protein
MDKPQPKKKRQSPLKIDLSFDEAMKKIVEVKPQPKRRND